MSDESTGAATGGGSAEDEVLAPKALPMRLSTSEERRLARLALPWVAQVARRVQSQTSAKVNADDLISCGHEALVTIMRRYDPARSPFEGYVRNRLRFAMLDVLRRDHRTRRRATALMASMLTILGTTSKGVHDDEMPPSEARFRRRFMQSLSEHTVAMMFGLASAECAQFGNAGDDHRWNPERDAQRSRLRADLQRAIAALTDTRERSLIEGLYFSGDTLETVSQRLNLSRSWASRLHSRAIRRLAASFRRGRQQSGAP